MQGLQPQSPINYLQVFTRRKLLIFFIALCTTLASVGFAIYSKPVYTATSTLLIAFRDPVNTDNANSVLPAMLQEEYMATQIGIISSKYMSDKVLDYLDFENDPQLTDIYQKLSQEENSATTIRHRIKKWMLSHQRVYVHKKRTRLVKVAFTNTNQDIAIKLSNAFAQKYLDAALELNLAPIRSSARWIEENTQSIRKSLEEAEKVLSGKPSNDEIALIDSLLSATRHDLNTLMLMFNNRSIDVAGERDPQFVLKVRSEILENQQVVIEKSRTLGPRDEELVAAQSEAVFLKNVFLSEVKKQVDSMKAAVTSLNQSFVLKGNVTQSNVTLLNFADVDVESNDVSIKTAAIYGAILGLMLGVMGAFFSFLGRKTHSADPQ